MMNVGLYFRGLGMRRGESSKFPSCHAVVKPSGLRWLALLIVCFSSLVARELSAANTAPVVDSVVAVTGPSVLVDHPSLYKFYVRDQETASNNLQLSLTSSNPALLPASNVVFHYFLFDPDGQHWYMTMTPAFGQTGTGTVTVNFSDGTNITSTNITLTVSPPPSGGARFANSTPIGIPLAAGPATVYPSTISVSGMSGTTTNVTVSLRRFSHEFPGNVHMMLVSPTGQKSVFWSKCGRGTQVTNVNATMTDRAFDFAPLPDEFEIWSEQFRPTDRAGTWDSITNNFPAPAPAPPYPPVPLSEAFYTAFNGASPNGTWSLYVYDDTTGAQGSIAGGWSLMVLTAGAVNQSPTISDIGNQATTTNVPTAAIPFTIGDAETPAASLTLGRASSNTTLVPTNNIVFGGSGANRTVTVTPAAGQTGTATITVSVRDGTNTTSDDFLLTVTQSNTPPTISTIANQSTPEDAPTSAIAFTIGDSDTPSASLTLSNASSNTTLVPTNNIVFGGSGSNRTVTVTPATNLSGSATITITVSDGLLSRSTNFVLTVTPVNDAPAISDIPDQLTATNVGTGPIAFTVGDVETAAGSLTLLRASSNTGLVPTNNIVFGGSGGNRTVTVTPATGQSGQSTISVTVRDGTNNTTDTFVLTVVAPGANQPPTIGTIPNQTTIIDQPTYPFLLVIDDPETAKVDLRMTATSSDQSVVPNANIFFGTFTPNQYLTVTPAFGRASGTATITVNVSDGTNSASTNFLFTINPPPTGWSRFANTNAVSIPDSGVASPYPSTINVSSMGGTIANLELTISRFSHQFVPEVDMLLVSPSGQEVMLMSGVAEGRGVSNSTITLTDSAPFPLPQSFDIWPQPLQPTDWIGTNVLPSPAPARPYGATAMSTFNGLSANGNWTLYVNDRFPGASGTIAGGWSLLVATTGGNASAPSISDIPNQTTVSNVPTAAIPFIITDPDTALGSLTLLRSSSNPTLVPTNGIVFGGSGSNRTVTVTPAAGQLGTATITVTVSDGTNTASDNFLLTVNQANTPPSISTIANQSTPEDTATAAIPFTIGDSGTPVDSLVLTKASSNTALIPTNNIVFGGSGSNRTVTVTPVTNLSGSATITITVSDGLLNRSTNFVLTVTPVNDGPVMSDIPDQATIADSSTAPYPFTVGDVETAAGSLTLAAGSSNPSLVATNNVIFGGSASNRTVSVTPTAGQTGQSLIFVTVGDGANETTDTFLLTVNPPGANLPPTISDVTDQVIDEDGTTGALAFTILDPETPSASLTLSRGSSNPALVPTNNIVLGGSGASRTMTITPAANVSGVSTITLTVGDGTNLTSDSFLLTVNDVNDAPSTTGIANQSTIIGVPVGPLNFTINDAETPAASLVVDKASSDETLVPLGNIVFGGSGSNLNLTVTPAPGLTGTADITLSVSDGTNTTSTNFILTVSVGIVSTISFTNGAMLTLSNALPGPASVYPSPIHVSGQSGLVTNVTVMLRNITHAWTRDIDVVLVAPNGRAVIMMSDGGNGAANGVTLTLSDAAPSSVPQTALTTGTFRPADAAPADVFPLPGPGAPFYTVLSAFKNQGPNGTWALYVQDDGTNDLGRITDGWTLTLTTISDLSLAPEISAPANVIISEEGTTGLLDFTVGDADDDVATLAVTAISSHPALISTNNIVLGGSGANRTVSVTPTTNATGPVTIWLTVNDGTNTASTNFLVTMTGINDAPTITGITNRTVNEDLATSAISFTIIDVETPAASLQLSKDSSDPVLVPISNIVFGGSGSNRTVTVTPAANQSGSAIITLTVSDGTNSATTNFLLTVNPVNDAPALTGVGDQTIDEDIATPLLNFLVGDIETEAASLLVTRGSSNPALVPASNIVLGGSDSNRTVVVTPAPDVSGTATITLTVSDGTNTASTNFVVTVLPSNDAPTVSGIADQTIDENGATGLLNFTVGDVETLAADLAVSGDSSNPSLIPVGNIVLGGAGVGRTVQVTPLPGQNGSAIISLIVSDGTNSASTNFLLTVNGLNHVPTITGVGDQAVDEDGVKGPLGFEVADGESPAASLTLIGSSSNPSLVPSNNIVFGGAGSNRTLTVTPAAHANGTATITVAVSDGTNTATTNFVLTVNPVNDAPTIGSVADQSVLTNLSTAPFSFVVGDRETAAGALTLIGGSSNPALVPTNSIVFGGTDSNRTVTITPATDAEGASTITLSVSDGTTNASTSFVLTVFAGPKLKFLGRDGNGDAVLELSVIPLRDYTIQGGTNFADWVPLGVVQSTNSTVIFTDTNTSMRAFQFYRARLEP